VEPIIYKVEGIHTGDARAAYWPLILFYIVIVAFYAEIINLIQLGEEIAQLGNLFRCLVVQYMVKTSLPGRELSV